MRSINSGGIVSQFIPRPSTIALLTCAVVGLFFVDLDSFIPEDKNATEQPSTAFSFLTENDQDDTSEETTAAEESSIVEQIPTDDSIAPKEPVETATTSVPDVVEPSSMVRPPRTSVPPRDAPQPWPPRVPQPEPPRYSPPTSSSLQPSAPPQVKPPSSSAPDRFSPEGLFLPGM